jgi:phage tail tube protein FII
MATIFEMDMANLFAGDDDPANSQHLTIQEVKIPALQEKTSDHTPGGGVMGIQIGMRILEPLELTFKLKGINPTVMNRFGVSSPVRRKYTVLGNVRDLQTGRDIPLKVVAEARMIKVELDAFSRDNGMSTDYQLAEVMHYELWLDGVEKYYFSFFEGPSGARVDGVAMFGDAARNLGLA